MRSLVLLLTLAATASAQPSGLYLTGSVARSDFDADRLALLGETYSAYYRARLDAPVDLLPAGGEAFSVGATGRINVGLAAAFGYQYGESSFEATSRFENGSGDHVTTRAADHAAWIETTVGLGPVVVGAHMGGLFRGMRIESATVHADGSESLGSEYRMNGVYTGSTTVFEVGPVVAFQIGDRILVPARVLFPVEFGGTTRLELTDFDTRQGNDYFPRDFDRFAADPTGSDFGATVSDRDFVGRRLQVGVELRLF